MHFGLSSRDLETISKIFSKYSEVKSVVLFGSRALGNYKNSSDIDLVILDENISSSTFSKIKNDLEESTLPYFVDLIMYSNITEPNLINQIQKTGIKFWERNEK